MTDFNNLDPNNMQDKADEVVADVENIINESEAQQPQPEAPTYQEAPQPNPYQAPGQPYGGQPQYQAPQQPYGQQQYKAPQQPYGQQQYQAPQQPYGQQQYQAPQQPYGQPPQYQPYGQPQYNAPMGYDQKSKIVAGLLGIFLGGLGIHNFYLGFTSRAIIQIVVTIITCGIGSLWGFIEGIMLICGSYNNNLDANGISLKD